MKILAILCLLGGVAWLLVGSVLIETAPDSAAALQGLFAAVFGVALLGISGAIMARIAAR